MIARSHDGTVAPSHVVARHTYAATFDAMRAEQDQMEREADAALARITEELQPVAGEEFWVAARYSYGWRAIYYNASPLTRMLAVRMARLQDDPRVLEIAVLRSLGQPERLAYKMRRFRDLYNLTSISLAQ